MTTPTVTLPRIVGQPSVAAAALVPYRWEPRLAVSFAGVVEVTMPALREIVQTGTSIGNRPLHLLDVNDSIRHAVGVFLQDEPIFAPFVLFEPLPAEDEPEPDPEPLVPMLLSQEDWRLVHDGLASLTTNVGLRESAVSRLYTKGADPIPFERLEEIVVRLRAVTG